MCGRIAGALALATAKVPTACANPLFPVHRIASDFIGQDCFKDGFDVWIL
jgi:hypothetical protein